jgi:hypothetical protein
MKYIVTIAAVLIVLLALQACVSKMSKKQQMEMKKMNHFELGFTDSSVPPPFHRSYEITVSGDTIHLIVNSYGDILVDTTLNAPPMVFDTIQNLLLNHRIVFKKKISKKEVSCTGGTTKYIAYRTPNLEEGMDGSIYYCGGKEYGNIGGDLSLFMKELEERIIPDLRGIINETRG